MAEEATTAPADTTAAPAPTEPTTTAAPKGAAPAPPDAAKGAAPKAGDTAKTMAGGATDAEAAPSKWPEAWRDDMAGGDEKISKILSRYATPGDAAKALREAQKTIDGGLKKQTLAADATEEQVAAYREANGIPEKAAGYLDSVPDGLVIGKDDEAAANTFLEKMHAANAPPAFVHEALGWYNELKEQETQQTAINDKTFHNESVGELREEWGSEFQMHMNSVTNLLDTVSTPFEDGTPFADWLQEARTPDGHLLGDHPAFMKTMLTIANQINPAGVVMPGEGMGQIDSVNSEIAETEKLINAGSPAYWNDPKKQERYRNLLEARERLDK